MRDIEGMGPPAKRRDRLLGAHRRAPPDRGVASGRARCARWPSIPRVRARGAA